MNWLTTLAFAVLLLSLHCHGVQGKKHSSNVSKSPWADPVKAKAFMDCLIKKIEQSDVIPQKEKEDMENLVQTLMSALTTGNDKGSNSKATLQAMNMAFASALAELVVAEGADDPAGIEVKTNALIKILQQCFKKTMHKIDKKFIFEIKDLIQMFVKEAAEETNEAEEDNEFPEDYGYNIELQTNDQASKETYITNYQLQKQMDDGTGGPSGVPSDSTPGGGMTPERLVSAMVDSQVIGSLCRGLKSPEQIKTVMNQGLTPAIQASMRLDGTSASNLANLATNGMMSLPRGSSPREYVKVMLTGPLGDKLRESGILNDSSAMKLFLKTLYNGLIDIGARYGVMIPRDAADKDMLSSTSSLTTVTTSQTSYDSQPSGKYPGGQYPDDGTGGPSGVPSDSTPGGRMTPERLVSAMADSQVIGSLCRGLKSPVQIKTVMNQGLTPAIQASMRLDGTSASNLANLATNGMMSLPRGSSPREYVKVMLTGPLGDKLRESGILNDSSGMKLFLKTLYNGLINIGARYGVMIPRDAADKDMLSSSSSLTTVTSIQSSFGEYPGGQSPDERVLGPSGFISDSVDVASLNNILNSKNVLNSPEANLRVKSLTSALQQAIGDDGINPSVFSSVLRASFSRLRNSGMTSEEATVEGLMELVAALVHLVGSSRPDPLKSAALSSSIQMTTLLADALS